MGMVDFIVRKMKQELEAITESGKPVTVVATGGMASMIDSGLDCIDHVDKLLTLEGLEIIYEKNRKEREKKLERQSRHAACPQEN
jgi:type III pantothenate kinase